MSKTKSNGSVRNPMSLTKCSQIPTLFIAILGLILSYFIFDLFNQEELSHLRDNFMSKSKERVSVIAEVIDDNFSQLYAMAALFNTLDSVSPKQFDVFANKLLAHHDALSLQYAPYIRDEDRSDFEKNAKSEAPFFQIKQRSEAGGMMRANQADAYLPVYYSRPLEETLHFIGYDFASAPAQKAAIDRAIREQQVIATAPFSFLHKKGSASKSILAFEAIYKRGSVIDTEAQRRENLEGFVVLALDGEQAIEGGLSFQEAGGIHIQVLDISKKGEEINLYTHRSRYGRSTERDLSQGFADDRMDLFYSETVSTAGRTYRLICIPIRGYRHFFGRNNAVFFLGASLFITILLTFYMGFFIKKQQIIAVLVADLSKSEAETRAILENTTDAILRIDDKGRIEKINKAAEKLLGYNDKEIQGQHVKILVPEKYQQQHEDHLNEYQQTGRINILGMSGRELSVIQKMGGRIPVEISVIEIKIKEKTSFTAFLRNITERKRSEDIIQHLLEGTALKEGEQFFQNAALHFSAMMGADFSLIGKFDDLEHPQSITSLALCEAGKVGENIRYELQDTPSREVLSGRPCFHGQDVDKRFPKDMLLAEMKACSYLGIPLFGTKRNLLGILVCISQKPMEFAKELRDILKIYSARIGLELERQEILEALKRSEKNLEDLVDQKASDLGKVLKVAGLAQKDAEKSNQLKTEFLANMSHELRTPMHSIITFSRQGMEYIETWPKEEQHENLSLIHESGKRLLALLNALLDISKLEAGVVSYAMTCGSIMKTAESVTRQLKGLIEQKHLWIDIAQNDSLSSVEYDEEKMTQVILNLVANAIKFSPSGGAIRLSFEDEKGIGAYLKVSVSDEGLGIPEDELQSVFDKFVQSRNTKGHGGGTGLGLAICKEIIENHHGSIWAENNNRGGATVAFRIPMKQPANRVNT